MQDEKPVVGISSCLLGQRVRYDGNHKRDDWLVKELGKWVQWFPVCPEMEMGLGAPRESMGLLREGGAIKLIGNDSGTNYTALCEKTSRRLTRALPALDGYVLKKSSPTCGLERVRTFPGPSYTGRGLYAERLVESRPLLPTIEEGRLTDPPQREHFVTRVFAHFRARQLPARMKSLQDFHQGYKLLLMAHSPDHYRKLGRMVANAGRKTPRAILEEYLPLFNQALARPATPGRQANVLQHVLGYFKKQLGSKEKQGLVEAIEDYRTGNLSFLAALKLMEQLLIRLPSPYLETQLYFAPYPKALNLRRFL